MQVRTTLLAVAAFSFTLVSGQAAVKPDTAWNAARLTVSAISSAATAVGGEEAGAVSSNATQPGTEGSAKDPVFRSAANVRFREISFTAGEKQGRLGPAGPTGTLVYSNTQSSVAFSPGYASFPVADDMRTTSLCDCEVAAVTFAISGGGDGTGPGFDVHHILYDDCPVGGGVPIAGSAGTYTLPNDGDFLVTIDFSTSNVVIGRNVWLQLTPSSATAATYWGSPAELGYSADYYYNPFGNCFTGFGPGMYASVQAQIYCGGDNSAPVATSPSPADGAQDIPFGTTLSWNGASSRGAADSGTTAYQDSAVVIPDAIEEYRPAGEIDRQVDPSLVCSTFEEHLAKNPPARDAAGGCALQGLCDVPATRDQFIPDANTPIKTFRLSVHVFCFDDGSGCVATQTSIDAQIASLNVDYEPFRMAFIYETAFHNDTQFRDVISADIDLMKTTYADSPDSKLNIYVANRPDSDSSFATFPWSFDALGATGGIMLKASHLNIQRILSHEVGHAVGLWHTHHGVDEAVGCADPCYEQAGFPSDTTGDFCSDTNPMPTNNACADAPGNDPCSGNPWSPVPFRNIMAYTSCPSEWTLQQAGRVQCWSEAMLTSWMELQCIETYDVYFGTTNPPTTLICAGTDVPTCDPGPLDCNTTYYWQVVTHLVSSTTPGPVWSFTTIGGADCNANGTPDTCEIALGMIEDCQSNGVPDDCDVDPADPDGNGQVSADLDSNGIPDECMPPLQPLVPAASPYDVRKHRYISLDCTTSGTVSVALKVTLTEMKRCTGDLERACTVDNDCDDGATGPCIQHPDVGSQWWVQAPQTEPQGCLPGPCGPTDRFARVDSAMFFNVWTDAVLHVGDCEIVPIATYEIRSCLPPDGTFCSTPLTIGTIAQPFISPGFRGNYGDVAGAVVGTEFTPPDGFGNVTDTSAYVLTAQNYGTANTPQTHPTWVDLNGLGPGQPPQYILNIADLGQILKALQGDKWTTDPGNLNPGSCP